MSLPDTTPDSSNEIIPGEVSSQNKVSSIIFKDALTSLLVDDPCESFIGVPCYYKYSLSSFSRALDLTEPRPLYMQFRIFLQNLVLPHQESLTSAGILRPLWMSSVLSIQKNRIIIKELISRWSRETHSFWCDWGEFSIALEDVVALLELPLAEATPLPAISLLPEEQTLCDHLVKCRNLICQMNSNPTLSDWLSYLQNYLSAGDKLALAGLLSFWLHSFIFPSHKQLIPTSIFRIASVLACGRKVDLASAFLDTIYMHLDQITYGFYTLKGRGGMISAINTWFLQLFLFEHFPSRAPPRDDNAVVRSWNLDILGKELPRAFLWHACDIPASEPLGAIIDYPDNFTRRPYTHKISGFAHLSIYPDIDIDLNSYYLGNNSNVSKEWVLNCFPHAIWAFDENSKNAHNLVPVAYRPDRMLRQFGYIQHWPHHFDVSFLVTVARDFPFMSLSDMLMVPSKLHVPQISKEVDVTPSFATNWHRHSNSLKNPILPNTHATLMDSTIVHHQTFKRSGDFGETSSREKKTRPSSGYYSTIIISFIYIYTHTHIYMYLLLNVSIFFF